MTPRKPAAEIPPLPGANPGSDPAKALDVCIDALRKLNKDDRVRVWRSVSVFYSLRQPYERLPE